MNEPYGISRTLGISYAEAVEKVTAALKEEGFGVLTEIDVKMTLKNKLDVEFRRYVILGACNPPNAYRALTAELEIGLLLPCNVIVYENGKEETVVSALNPMVAMGMVENPTLEEVARGVTDKLQRVISSLE